MSKANFTNIGKELQVSFGLEELSPRDQANLCTELMEIIGIKRILQMHNDPGTGNYQSVTTEIWTALSTHWSTK